MFTRRDVLRQPGALRDAHVKGFRPATIYIEDYFDIHLPTFLSNSFLQKSSSIMAQAGEVLFKLPIAATNGEIVVTQPKPQVYLLTFNSPDDNRLLAVSYLITLIGVRRPDVDCFEQEFCDTFRLALDILEARYEPGVLITTSGIAKYNIP
jgi:hypothetical protein